MGLTGLKTDKVQNKVLFGDLSDILLSSSPRAGRLNLLVWNVGLLLMPRDSYAEQCDSPFEAMGRDACLCMPSGFHPPPDVP
jgi:hypothetical protein